MKTGRIYADRTGWYVCDNGRLLAMSSRSYPTYLAARQAAALSQDIEGGYAYSHLIVNGVDPIRIQERTRPANPAGRTK